MPEKDEFAYSIDQQETTTEESIVTNGVPPKTGKTISTLYPDAEYVNRTLP